MANNDRIFKPRRGTKTTFSSTKSNTVLSEGELFFEVPDTGQGTGRVRVKMGDGITTYDNLPYAIPFTEDEIIIHNGTDDKTITASSSIQSTAIATNLNNAKSGNTLKNIIHNLREAIYKCACDISYLDSNKQVIGSYAAASHTHSEYASTSHTHSQYSSTSHNHDSTYVKQSIVGNEVYGTKYQPALSNNGGYLPCAVINLSVGYWILSCSGYSPISGSSGNNISSQPTSMQFGAYVSGNSGVNQNSYNYLNNSVSLTYKFCLVDFYNCTTENKRIDAVVINWEKAMDKIGNNYTYKAIRIK